MKIHELINAQLISQELIAKTKDGVIYELAELLHRENRITSLKDFIMDIKERESLGSTGIGLGIAIPHAKSKHVLKPSLVYGFSKQGIDYESLDDEKAHLFFMIAMPEEGSNMHLKTLALLSRSLIHETFRTSLIEAHTKMEILDILKTVDKEES